MKGVTGFLCLLIAILLINSCAIFSGGAVWAASNQINQSSLSAENEQFEQDYGIKLVIIKRGLWSMQNTYKNKSMEQYFLNLLNNNLTYTLNNDQDEFVKQVVQDDNINIIVKNQFSNYSDYERAILLIASTSALALLSDTGYNQNNVSKMFFNFIESYDTSELPSIVNSQWYKNKRITIKGDGIFIN